MKPEDFWDEEAILKDLLFESNMPLTQVAKEMDKSQKELNALLKRYGLTWVRRNNRKLSRGHAALLGIMQNLLPNETIVTEHHIGDRLKLDIYCPTYNIAAEYHGRQHFFYSNLFHGSIDDFEEGVRRDKKKEEMCKDLGIALIAFRFCDKLTEQAVFERMLEAIKNTDYVPKERVSTFKGNHYYEKMKVKAREQRKLRYREIKKKNES